MVRVQDRSLLSTEPTEEAIAHGLWTASRFVGHGAVVVPADMPSLTQVGLDAVLRQMLPGSPCLFRIDQGRERTSSLLRILHT